MARLRDMQPKNTSGSYERLFDNAELGALASKVQAAVIRSGTELERLIARAVPKMRHIPNLDRFLKQEIMQEGVLLARNRQIKKSILYLEGAAPDFMVFKRRQDSQTCHVIELKDGHVFDTKKASVEHQTIHQFIDDNAPDIPHYRFQAHFCAFNQDDKGIIREGFKKKISYEEAMTGRELCELLEIEYDNIVEARRDDCSDNVDFFLSELAGIDSIRSRLLALLNG